MIIIVIMIILIILAIIMILILIIMNIMIMIFRCLLGSLRKAVRKSKFITANSKEMS